MSNEKLVKSMMNCDGSNKNCEGCAFRDIPECRNAMAHHAGALIQLQDVVISNSASLAGGLQMQLRAEKQAYAEAVNVVKKQRERIGEILNGLTALKHCESCAYSKEQGDAVMEEQREALCKACHEGISQWELSAEFGKPEPEDDNDDLGERESDDMLQPVEDEDEYGDWIRGSSFEA